MFLSKGSHLFGVVLLDLRIPDPEKFSPVFLLIRVNSVIFAVFFLHLKYLIIKSFETPNRMAREFPKFQFSF